MISPLQALWLATEVVHEETGSYGSSDDVFFVHNFLDVSVGITPDLAARVASIPINNFVVASGVNVSLDDLWQRLEQRFKKELQPKPDAENVLLLGDLAQAVRAASN